MRSINRKRTNKKATTRSKSIMKDVAVLNGEWDLCHLDDVLASQYQSSDWTLHTT